MAYDKDFKKVENWVKNADDFIEYLETKVSIISNKIVEKKFNHTPHGYNPEEVDKEIDKILNYYDVLKDIIKQIVAYASFLKGLTNNTEAIIEQNKSKIKNLEEQNRKLIGEGYGNMQMMNKIEELENKTKQNQNNEQLLTMISELRKDNNELRETLKKMIDEKKN